MDEDTKDADDGHEGDDKIVQEWDQQRMWLSLKQTGFVIFVYLLSIGIMVPIYPKLILNRVDTVSTASVWNGALLGGKCALEFLSMPILGVLSDREGRRPVFLLSAALAAAEYCLLALYPVMPVVASTRVLGGLTNGVITMTFAAIADVSVGASQGMVTKNFGIVGASFGLAFVLGPMTGGILGSVMSVSVPCWIAAGLMLVELVFLVFVWEETLKLPAAALLPASAAGERERERGRQGRRRRRRLRLADLSPLPALRIFLRCPALTSLVPPFFFSQLAQGVVFVWFLYLKYMWDWEQAEVGQFLSCAGLLVLVVQGCLIRRLVPEVVSEKTAVLWGFSTHALAYALYGIATMPWMAYSILVLDALSSLADPSLQALMVRYVGVDELGALQGACDSLRTLSQAIGSPVFSGVFAFFVSSGASGSERVLGFRAPGAHLFLGAGCFLVAAASAWCSFRKYGHDGSDTAAVRAGMATATNAAASHRGQQELLSSSSGHGPQGPEWGPLQAKTLPVSQVPGGGGGGGGPGHPAPDAGSSLRAAAQQREGGTGSPSYGTV